MEKNRFDKKNISALGALALVVGMIIGSGIFLKPGVVLGSAGSTGMSILAWVLGGVITLASALSVAEISVKITKSGGLYTYLEEIYGPIWGFMLGWVQSVIGYPASVAAQSIAFSAYLAYFTPLTDGTQKVVAIAVLAFLLIINVISTKYGSYVQILATIGKLVPVIAIIAFGLISGNAPGAAGLTFLGATAVGLGPAVLGTLWAYDGWIGVTNMSGEIENPKKNLPLVIAGGVIFVIIVYVLFNIAVFWALPYESIVSSPTPGADAAKAFFGSSGGAIITAGIVISVFGSLNGYLMTAARVPQAMGERGALPFSKVLGALHPKFKTPTNALIFQSLLAVVYIMSGSFNSLTDLLVFVLWIFFTMGVGGLFILRKRSGVGEGYKVPLYPITPIIGILGGVYILVSTFFDSPIRSLLGIGIALLGLPVYLIMNKKAIQK